MALRSYLFVIAVLSLGSSSLAQEPWPFSGVTGAAAPRPSKTSGSGIWTYLYDAGNLLTEVRRDGVLVQRYQYDPEGR